MVVEEDGEQEWTVVVQYWQEQSSKYSKGLLIVKIVLSANDIEFLNLDGILLRDFGWRIVSLVAAEEDYCGLNHPLIVFIQKTSSMLFVQLF